MQIENTKLRVVNEVSNMNMLALPLILVVASVSLAQGHLPVVIWHGMGDNCCHDFSMGYIKQVIEDNLPGVYVRSLMVSKLSDRIQNLASKKPFCCRLAMVPMRTQLTGFSNPSMSRLKKCAKRLSPILTCRMDTTPWDSLKADNS